MSKVGDKRQAILHHVATHGKITKQEINDMLSGTYYCNGDKHLSEIVSRMVKAGILKREKRGVYVAGERPASRGPVVKNHPKLF